jgi:opacity protein-like surface antigen
MSKMLLLACLMLSVSARAELRTGQTTAGVAIGSAGTGTRTDWRSAGGSKENDYEGGSAFAAQYLYQLSPNVGIGGEFEFSNLGQKDHTLTQSVVRMGGQLFTVEAVTRYSFFAHKKWHPFIMAGLGVASGNVYALTTPRAGFTWAGTGTRETRTNWNTTLTGASASLGLGVEAELNDRLAVGLDLRLRSRAVDKTVVDGALGGTHDFAGEGGASLLLRLGYRFGGEGQIGFIK